MHASEYLRENLVHSSRIYGVDEHEEVSNNDELSGRHRSVHDPSQEIEVNDIYYLVGTDKHNWSAQKETYKLTAEDHRVDKGDWEDDEDDDDDWGSLPNFFSDDDDDEDDDEEDD